MLRTLWGLLICLAFTGCDDGSTAADPALDAGISTDASVEPDAAAQPDAALEPDAAAQPDAAPPPPPAQWGIESAEDTDPDPAVVAIDLAAGPHQYDLGDGVRIDGFAYNDQVPGPVIQARVGDTIVVRFRNNLAEPTTVHWHGLRISDQMDGSPLIQDPVQPGETFEYRFEAPEVGTYWYHPHVRTNEQLEKGLYGMLIVHPREDLAEITDRAIILDDILADQNGLAPFLASHPEVMHGRSGNILLTNGRPELPVGQADEGDTERWRIVNTANARTMVLRLEGAQGRVIAVDGGPLAEPYAFDELTVPVGQRYEIEVGYTRPGRVSLVSLVPTVQNDRVINQAVEVLAVEVAETGVLPRNDIAWPHVEAIADRAPRRNVELRFDGVNHPTRGLQWTLNEHAFPEEPLFVFEQGDTVRIKLRNLAGPEHPFHLHGQFFRIFPDGRPETEQPGLKDTVLVPGESEVQIIAYFDNPGAWMAHCHILEHAELGMMAEFVVLPND
jgi:FtsP/CotA-like multicopper oxidase with cupredoxin domain